MKKTEMLGQIILVLVKVPNGAIGTILDLLRRVTHEETGDSFIEDLKAWLNGSKYLVQRPFVDWIGTVQTVATTKRFVAKDNFKLEADGGICSHLGINFQSWFLVDEGKVEDPLGEQKLRFGRLTRRTSDSAIIEELGGEMKVETTLIEVFDQILLQSNANEGDIPTLNTKGPWNIFYVRDISGVLRVVVVCWHRGGWKVDAYAVSTLCEWLVGFQVFYRDSLSSHPRS